MTPIAGGGKYFQADGNKIQIGKEANSKRKGRKIQEFSFHGSRLFRNLSRELGNPAMFDLYPAIKQGVWVKQQRGAADPRFVRAEIQALTTARE
jgi:hypothetical protein